MLRSSNDLLSVAVSFDSLIRDISIRDVVVANDSCHKNNLLVIVIAFPTYIISQISSKVKYFYYNSKNT